MTQSVRQSSLFTAEDWQNLYSAFVDINFTAYDFDSIRQALAEYIRINYPEDFNDFIDSSELVAFIDLLAYLGQSLAFRMDLNARENFLDTASRRESILKLARLLSYKPKRNLPARGLLKVVAVRTDDDIVDSNNKNIAGQKIEWNDANSDDWFEHFILIFNSAFSINNQFGDSNEKSILYGVANQFYRLDNIPINAGAYSFNSQVDNTTLNFEAVNISLDDTFGFKELNPDPNSAFHLMYRNDGNGNQSLNTGFFLYFKQGSLQYQDFNLKYPIENRVLNIDTENINETDVWVQTINESGTVLKNWTRVPETYGSNVIYNDIDKGIRNIFSVQTQDNDKISVRFGDGRFGNAPTGIIRVWFRTSVGANYIIRPQDMQNIDLVIPYINKQGLSKNLVLTLSLQEPVTNSQPRETDEQIRRRAPQVYYSQNRMVSGEDYNVFPLDNTQILKLKALNRTYSGHSRFIDINDPTGMYQNTNVFSEDGILYREINKNYLEIPRSTGVTTDEVISNYLQPAMQNNEFFNFLNEMIRNVAKSSAHIGRFTIQYPVQWNEVVSSVSSTVGRFVRTSNPDVMASITNDFPLIGEKSLVKFRDFGWTSVQSISYDSAGNDLIRLVDTIPDGDVLEAFLPPLRTTLNSAEIDEIRSKINNNRTFGIYYDYLARRWKVINPPTTDITSFAMNSDFNYDSSSAKWMVVVENAASGEQIWKITLRGVRYVFESEKDVRFFFVSKYQTQNNETGLEGRDNIKVLRSNSSPEALLARKYKAGVRYMVNDYVYVPEYKTLYKCKYNYSDPSIDFRAEIDRWYPLNPSLNKDINWALTETYTYSDGYIEPRRVIVDFADSNDDGLADNPEQFDEIVFGNAVNNSSLDFLVFFQRYTSSDGYEYYAPFSDAKAFWTKDDMDAQYSTNPQSWVDGTVGYCKDTETYYVFDMQKVYLLGEESLAESAGFNIGDPKVPSLQTVADTNTYVCRTGRTNIQFNWKHFAPSDHRIDPAITNIIDTYVLTTEYDYLLRQWLSNGGAVVDRPAAPSEESLRLTFDNFNNYKMISDQIIWHPVKYKLLFGSKADEEYKAKLVIVKTKDATLSDGEIKAKVIAAINKYFDVENWDFGEPFYASELYAYVHQTLVTQIASVELVPLNEESRFGALQEIKCQPDEIFISCATVNDVEIVSNLTEKVLRVNK